MAKLFRTGTQDVTITFAHTILDNEFDDHNMDALMQTIQKKARGGRRQPVPDAFCPVVVTSLGTDICNVQSVALLRAAARAGSGWI